MGSRRRRSRLPSTVTCSMKELFMLHGVSQYFSFTDAPVFIRFTDQTRYHQDYGRQFPYPHRDLHVQYPRRKVIEFLKTTDHGHPEGLTYRVQLAFYDASDTIVFVSFDIAMAQLTNV